MTASLHQLTLTFDPLEDRILLRIGTAENTEYRLWLTRRFIKVLWGALMQIIDRDVQFREPAARQHQTDRERNDDTSKVAAEPAKIKDNLSKTNEDSSEPEKQIVHNKVKAAEHKEALQASDFSQRHAKDNVNLTSNSGPLLVVGCQVKKVDEQNTILNLKTSGGMGIRFGLNKKLLHALCHMMISSAKKAKWDLDLEVGDPRVSVPDIPKDVVH